ncbi:MAG: MBL fold metallo-hydrolase [Bacteroidales bacterium]
MKRLAVTLIALLVVLFTSAQKVDTIKTTNSKVIIHFIGHGSLMFEYNDKIIHIDPWSNMGIYDTLPKADVILLTHHHRDHLDSTALTKVVKGNTLLFWTHLCAINSKFPINGTVLSNGDTLSIIGIPIKVVPAYNIINKRPSGEPYHVKGEGNGYILNIDGLTIYVAGDTENIPEMKDLGRIDVAFLPMNNPFTMTPEMLKDAVSIIKPKILYPYHYGTTDTYSINNLLKDIKNTEVRIR